MREGFEPSIPFKGYGALAKRCFQPLSHLTKMVGREYDEELSIANTDVRRVLAIESCRGS